MLNFRACRVSISLAVLACFLPTLTLSARQDEQTKFELSDGDRVVLLGDGLIEQEQYFGWVELMLTTSFAQHDISFRNLGWNADTPKGKSRSGLSLVQAGYEGPNDGWNQLVKQLEFSKPNVVVLGYGMASALEGDTAAQFRDEYRQLIAKLKEITPNVRFLFLTPILPSAESTLKPEVIQNFAGVIKELAAETKSICIDLANVELQDEFRKDAIHLNGDGYRHIAKVIEQQLNLTDSEWKNSKQTEPLRQAILQKNEWWFHRSRPANMAYVFGFRKREQGQNAAEIPEFDKLIVRDEKIISQLKSLNDSALRVEPPRRESIHAAFTEQARPTFTVAEDLEVTLWAENPLLNKPIQMNFDAAGRLWIASSETYPMIEPGQAAADKIVVLEDTTGDGKADKSTVFAEGLLMPTGVIPGDGGAYVAQSTDLLFLKDTNGDGEADLKRRVLSGFGTEDTHHNLHTLTRGPDGRLYMNQSVYTRTDTETPHGVVRMRAGGGYRFSPQTMRLQPYFHGLWNSWGHQFDQYGQSFVSDGAGYAGLAYVFPGATIRPTPGVKKTLPLISPGRYPKFCAGEIIRGDTFPDSWQGTFVTCDFRANRLTRFKLIERDAGYTTEQQDDLIRTSETNFRPIDVKQGPDGALYVADWSNPIINHGEVDFRDPRRDRWHGRIWRITTKHKPARETTNLYELSVTELLDNLLSDDRYQTDQSRQVLIERKEETKAALPSWIAAQKSDTGRLQGLWMCQAVGVLEQELLQTLLQSETHQIRAAAVRVLGDWADPSTDLVKPMNLETSLGLFQKSILDEHPRVRLESVRGLAATRSVQGTELALRALERPFDPFLEHGLRLTINENADELIARMKTSGWVDHAENRQQQLEFVLTNVAPDKSASFLQNYISQNGVTAEGPWIELIGRSGSPRQLRALYQGLISDLFQNETKVRAAHALIVAAKRGQRPIGLEQPANRLRQLLDSEKSELRIAALSLLGQWRLSNAIPQVAVIANDLNESLQLRTKAIESLGLIGKQAANELEPIALNETADWSIRQTALKSLARTDFDRSLGPFFKLLSGSQTTEADATSLWRSMLSEKDAAKKILPLIPKDLSKTAAVAGLRVAREGGRVEKKLVEVLMPLADSSSTAELWSPARIPEYVASVEASGDPSKGELIYRRTELQCINCHAIGGVGGKVGPDMTSLGASAPLDYIVESMFDPNAKIKENYHSLVVLTIDGRTVTGIESGSTDEEIVLRDADNKLIRIPTDDVEGSKAGMSLMPAGLLDKISMEERVHLIAFLSQLGKPGDYDASRQNVARSLEIYADTHLTQQRGNEDLIAGREISGWKPMSTRVNGRIPKATLTSLTQQTGNGSLIGVFMRTKIQSNAGEVNLCVDGIAVAEMWIDGQPVTKIAKGDVPKDNNSEQPQVCFQPKLAEGEHVVLVRIDSRDIPEFLLIRSDGVTFVSD